MKKLFFLLLSVAVFSTSYAQLPDNSIAPDWTLRDLNGNTHHLYAYLDSGYTVFIDISAAWCGPCWAYHNTHALRDLYENHGPAGAPGVLSGTTNDAMVFYIEGESTNTTAQLRGVGTSGTTHADFTQGDWVTGTPYPMIDSGTYANTFNSNYAVNYFPTIYKICPDRRTTEVGQLTASALYSSVGTCVNATTANDPSMVTYTGQDFTFCGSLDVKAILQNHGTATLTSATIQVLQGSTVLTTYNWSGSLAKYATANVNIGTVATTSTSGVVVKITSANDDLTNDQIGVTFTALSTTSAPYTASIESAPDYSTPPAGMYITDKDLYGAYYFQPYFLQKTDFTVPPTQNLGAYENSSHSICYFWSNYISGLGSSLVVDKITIPTLASGDKVMLGIDYAYAQRSSADDAKLELMYSKDCGGTWTTPFNKQGSLLSTRADVAISTSFIPVAADWKSDSFDITSNVASGDQLVLKARSTSGGNNLWMDNIKVYLKSTGSGHGVGIKELVSDVNLNVYPNPASTVLNTTFTSDKSQTVTIKMVDMNGKVVYEASNVYGTGVQNATINVENMPAGAYSLTFSTETTITAKNIIINH